MIEKRVFDGKDGYISMSGTQGVFGYTFSGTYFNKKTKAKTPYTKIVLEEVYEIKGGKNPGLKKRESKKFNATISFSPTLAKNVAEMVLALVKLGGSSDDEVGDLIKQVGMI